MNIQTSYDATVPLLKHTNNAYVYSSKDGFQRDFPIVQGLRLLAPNAGAMGSIPGQGARSIPQASQHGPLPKKRR